MIQFSFVKIKVITVHNLKPMPVPAIYVCNEFTKQALLSNQSVVKVSPKHLCTGKIT